MKTDLQVTLTAVNDNVRFHASVPGKRPIVVDYFSPPEDDEGVTSLELLLMSAASCLATAVKLIVVNRLGKTVSSVAVDAAGTRRESLPTDFTQMTFALRFESADLSQDELTAVVENAKAQVCPVFAMLRSDVDTRISATVVRPGAATVRVEGGAA